MEDVTYSDGKLHVGASWYRLSMINEVIVERSIPTFQFWYLAVPLLLTWLGFHQRESRIWFWVLWALYLTLIVLKTMFVRDFRVFVCMDSGRYEVAKIRGDDFRLWCVRIAEAERRARALVEEIRGHIPDRA
jgi:hypothetical protein